MRAVARLGEERCPLYGDGPYEASRVDSFLDASLVFARDAQAYLQMRAPRPARQAAAFAYLAEAERAAAELREMIVDPQDQSVGPGFGADGRIIRSRALRKVA